MTPMELVGSLGIVGYGLGAIGPGIGVGLIFASVIQGTARQPEARGAMMGTAWIGFAVTEALAIIGIALAFVFGGMVILKRLNFSQALIIAYMALSSVAFLINFGLNFWGFLRISRQGEKVKALDSPATTSELPPADIAAVISPAPSVTENTTRSFESVYAKRKPE